MICWFLLYIVVAALAAWFFISRLPARPRKLELVVSKQTRQQRRLQARRKAVEVARQYLGHLPRRVWRRQIPAFARAAYWQAKKAAER
jgi:hypothetical protein